jgi:hypothetical protein
LARGLPTGTIAAPFFEASNGGLGKLRSSSSSHAENLYIAALLSNSIALMTMPTIHERRMEITVAILGVCQVPA